MIRVGRKFRRGVPGDGNPSVAGFVNIDVTSGGLKKVGGEVSKSLSPMILGPVIIDGKEISKLFENYWQFGKMWEKAGHFFPNSNYKPTEAWKTFRKKGYASTKRTRRPFPKKSSMGLPVYSRYKGVSYDYISSRKMIYVPMYADLIRDLPIMKELRKLLKSGQNIMIIDGDGPPKPEYNDGEIITKEFWKKMINDKRYPFGHGYVVAALLANLDVPELKHRKITITKAVDGWTFVGNIEKDYIADQFESLNKVLNPDNGRWSNSRKGRWVVTTDLSKLTGIPE